MEEHEKQYNKQEKNKFNINHLYNTKKRKIIIGCSFTVLIVISFIIFNIVKVNTYRKDVYTTISYIDTYVFTSATITDKISEYWHDGIFNSSYENYDKHGKSFSNMDSGVKYAKEESKNLIDIFDKISNITETKIKEIKNPPYKYSDAKDILKELFTDINKLSSLTKNPEGSYQSYNEKLRELYDRIEKNKTALEYIIPKPNNFKEPNVIEEINPTKNNSISRQKSNNKNDKFLANNKTKEGVQTTASGLQYKIVKQGNGVKPTVNDRVRIQYSVKLTDGKVIESTFEKGQEPVLMGMTEIIPGMAEGLQLMSEGSTFLLWLSPELGYGDVDSPEIPAGSVLFFEVQLVEVVKK